MMKEKECENPGGEDSQGKPTTPVVPKLFGKLTVEEIRKAKTDVWMPTPTEPLPYGTEQALFDEIRAYFVQHLDLSADIQYHIAALFTMATWRVEQAANATYLNLLAAHGNGKSTFCEILQLLCFKAIHSEGATRGAIVRLCNGNNATMILDEADNWLNPRDYDNPLAAVLNAGYRRRIIAGGVLICEQTSDGKYATVQYDSFGFKVIAGRNPLNDTLGSRCIEIRMRKSDRKFPKPDYEQAWNLRKKLLKYQQQRRDEPLETDSANHIEDSRLREVFEPLLAAAPTDEIQSRLIGFANEEAERRQKQELASDEAAVARAVIEIAAKEPRTEIAIKEISDAVNLDVTNPKEQISRRYIGVLLRRHGFSTEHAKEGNTIKIDQTHLDYLKQRYVAQEKPTVLPLEIYEPITVSAP